MKRIFTISAIAFSAFIFSQEAGKSGELLKNEANKTEMQTQRREVLGNRSVEPTQNMGNTEAKVNSAFRKNNSYGQNNNRTKNYQWSTNFGYSEVFLRIPERGFFTVEVGDQMMSNTSGKFRFFDLPAGRIPVSIYENGYLLYRTKLNVRNNSRMVLDFFTDYGLYLLDTVSVRNQIYGFNEWDDVWNNPYGNGNLNNNYGNNNYFGNVMNNDSFSRFLQAVKKNSFDDDRLRMVEQQSRSVSFTAEQIKSLMKIFSFEDKRVDLAKSLYIKCVDRQNFYIVYDVLNFSSSKKELSDYINRI